MADAAPDPEAALDALLDAPEGVVTPTVVETPPEVVAEVIETPPEVVEPTAEELAAQQQEAEGKTQERFRFKNDEDQAVALLAKSRGISLIAAADILRGQQPVEVEPEVEINPIEAIDAEIAERKTRIQALRTEAEEQVAPVDQAAIDALLEEITDFKVAKGQHEVRQQLASETQAERRAREAQEADDYQRDQAYTDYPSIKEAGSPLYNAVTARVTALGGRVSDPQQIYDIVASEAAKLRILPAVASQPGSSTQPGVTPPPNGKPAAKAQAIIPVSAAASTTPPRHSISHQEPDAATVFQEKIKVAKTDADIDDALGLAPVTGGRLGAWS